jgi:hypothetical protein
MAVPSPQRRLGSFVLATIVGVVPSLPVAAARPSSALGQPEDVLAWMADRGLVAQALAAEDDLSGWSASGQGLTLTVRADDRGVRHLTLDTDLTEAGPSTPGFTLMREWLVTFAPDGSDFVDHVLTYEERQGSVNDRQLRLADRILRVRHVVPDDRLRLEVRPLDQRYVVKPVTGIPEPCRPPDPATGAAAEELRVEFAANVRNVRGRPGDHLWIVVAEPGFLVGPAALSGSSWRPGQWGRDSMDGSVIIPGPPLRRGRSVDLTWQLRFDDARDHWVEVRIAVGPRPVRPITAEQLEAAKLLDAVATWNHRWLASEPCDAQTSRPDADLEAIRRHVMGAIARLQVINDGLSRVVNADGGSTINDQLVPMGEMHEWAADERAWADAELGQAVLAAYPVLADWSTNVATLELLTRSVLATRGYDPDEVRSVLELLGTFLGTLYPRVSGELIPR